MSYRVENTALYGKVVIIMSPELIAQLTTSPDVNRVDTPANMGPAGIIFQQSPFFSPPNTLYPAFTYTNSPEFYPRLCLMEEQMNTLNKNIKREHLETLVKMVKGGASDEDLLIYYGDIGGANLFFGGQETYVHGAPKVSKQFLGECMKMPLVQHMTRPNFLFKPEMEEAHESLLNRAGGDILKLHNPIASTVLCPMIIKRVIMEPNTPVNDIITQESPLQFTLRITNKQTNLGILPESVPPMTLVYFTNGKAAKETKNTAFTFGHGTIGNNARLCPYRKFFIPFLQILRQYERSTVGVRKQMELDPHDHQGIMSRHDMPNPCDTSPQFVGRCPYGGC